jgi:NAD(P)-dependent dehydrogenase (short-subunit alcohol dehydrogenase family)
LHSGLGALLSTTFAKEGANVAINYFNRLEPAQEVQKQCQEAGVKAVVIKAVRVFDSL